MQGVIRNAVRWGSPGVAVAALVAVHLAWATPAHAIAFQAGEYTISVGDVVSVNVFYDDRDVGGYEGFFLAAGQEEDGNFNVDAGQSRLSLGVSGPGFWGGTSSALVAFDFLKSAEDGTSQNSLRMFYAWMQAEWASTPVGRLQVRIGQTETPLVSLIPDTVEDTPAFAFGALYSREAQVRVWHTFGSAGDNVQVAWALSQPNNGVFGITAASGPGAFGGGNDRTGTANAGGLPWLHGQVRLTTSRLGASDLGPSFVALSGFVGRERFDADDVNGAVPGAALPGGDDVEAWTLQLAVNVPIVPSPGGKPRAGSLGLRAAGHVGENVDSFFGGGLQGVALNASGTGLDPVESLGGWLMARLFLSPRASLYAMGGYEAAQDVEGAIVGGVATGNRVNRELLGGVDYRFTERVFSAIEYTHKESGFRGGGSADNQRLLWSWKYFF